MKQSLLKKIGLGVGGFVVLMALGLLANKGSNNNNKEEIFQVSESKFPLSDYFFEEVKEEPKEKAKETPEVTTQEPTTQTSPNPSVSANPNIKDYDPKAHKCLQERQKEEIQEKAQSNNSDEPWIEHGKRMQEKAKAHYQACLEREKAKELAKEQNNAQKEMPTIDYGYTQNTLSKSRRR
ncbi:hypothetical protein OUK_0693 [Helicobacter pylori R037c]|nr:hypothetical protein OUK_0693 [Helicobacter pylori R037c]